MTWLWGGFSVDNPTLNRFFSLHYLLPFVLVGVVFLHVAALHVVGSNNPLGIDVKSPQDTLPFHPYYTVKDSVGMCVFLLVFAVLVFFAPNFLGDANNFIPANPLQTPADIVPEWYFLPYYAILRSVPNKLLGVCMMFGSILILFVLPWLDTSRVRSARFRPIYRQIIWVWVVARDRPWRLWRAQAGRHLGGAQPYRHALLFPAFPGHPAHPGQARAAAAAAREHQSTRHWRRADRCLREPLPSRWRRRDARARTRSSLAALLAGAVATPATAQEAPTPPAQHWSFDGPFGSLDLAAAQRGFQVYSEVCAVCHSMEYLHYRDLAGIGLTADQIKAIAAAVTVPQGLDDNGEPKDGPATPADQSRYLPAAEPAAAGVTHTNEKAARAAHNGALPPDLSLIVNARQGHADYIYAVLTGYADPPAGMKMQEGMNYDKYFPGNQIAMPPPLHEGQVTYADGTKATVDQMAHDVVTFLAWAANPEMVERKQIGWRWCCSS